MAHFWVPTGGSEWAVATLHGEAFRLGEDKESPLQRWKGDALQEEDVLVVRRASAAGEEWCLLAGPGSAAVLVNGQPPALGIVALADKDLLARKGGLPLLFSTERMARVEPYAGGEASAVCPRCRQSIEVGAAAVRCPGCAVWYHATADLPCWTYSPSCSVCSQPSGLDGTFRWTPEEL